MRDGVVVDEADQLVLEGGQPFRAAPAVAVGAELPVGLGAGVLAAAALRRSSTAGRAADGAAMCAASRPRQLGADLAGVEIGGAWR